MAKVQSDTNCWDCKFQQIGGDTFLGMCTWFEKNGKGKNKEITPQVVDKGCKYFSKRIV
jgi:hypothetical protein